MPRRLALVSALILLFAGLAHASGVGTAFSTVSISGSPDGGPVIISCPDGTCSGGGGGGGGTSSVVSLDGGYLPALNDDVASTAAASESATTRLATTSAIRLLDTTQSAGSQLVIAKGNQTQGMQVFTPTVVGTPVTLSAACSSGAGCGANSTATISGAGLQAFSVDFTNNTGPSAMTVVADCSYNSGSTWQVTGSPSSSGVVSFQNAMNQYTTAITNPLNVSYSFHNPCGGATDLRVRVGAYTSGSIVATLRGVYSASEDPSYVGVAGTSGYPATAAAMMMQDPVTPTTGRLMIGNSTGLYTQGGAAVGGAVSNPVIAGGVSASGGTVNQATIKSAATAPVAGDTASVITLRPTKTGNAPSSASLNGSTPVHVVTAADGICQELVCNLDSSIKDYCGETNAVSTSSTPIAAGACYHEGPSYGGDVWCVSASGTPTVSVQVTSCP